MRAVSGNIGSGKTTLCQYLGKSIPNSSVFYEGFSENPYLEKFYQHMRESPDKHNPFALPMQLAFLEQRLKVESQADSLLRAYKVFTSKTESGDKTADTSDPKLSPPMSIIDRSIFEDHEIFAKNQLKSGMFTQDEYRQYLTYFSNAIANIQKPDAVILLDIDVNILLERIKSRGRKMESNLTREYLENLQQFYKEGLEQHLNSIDVPLIKLSLIKDFPVFDAEAANAKLLTELKRRLNLT